MTDITEERPLGSLVQGRYRLESVLARGSGGTVFLCEDLRLAGKRWVLKEMKDAAMLALPHHGSLPVVVDSFLEEFRRYVVMEYFYGETLAHKVERDGPATELEAVRWGGQLCAALSYLHSQNPPIIFRDLNPENIIVTEEGLLKLVDFGMATQLGASAAADPQARGTVGYAAPELGEGGDQRSDVYGLGATLHFMLTARPPGDPLGPVQPGLAAILVKCLHPDPSLRYPDCQQLGQDLQQWSDQYPTPKDRPKPPVASKKKRFSAAGIAALTCLAGSLLWLGLRFSSRAPEQAKPSMANQLEEAAVSKERARQAMLAGDPARADTILADLTRRYPEDGDAQILKNNALALQHGPPYLRIPVLDSISGTEYEGIQMLQGLALAQKELNRQGLIDGADPQAGRKSIILDFFDCRSLQNVTLDYTLRLVADPAVQVMIGPWTSQQAQAMSPILEGAGVPTISPVASDPRVWNLGNNTFTAADSDHGRLQSVARYFVDRGRLRAAVLHNDDNVVSQSSALEFSQILSTLGGKTVTELAYRGTDKDFRSLVVEVKRVKADFVFLSEYRSDELIEFARQMHAEGLSLPLGTQVTVAKSVIEKGGMELNGLVTSSYFYAGASSPAVQQFNRRFEELFGSVQPSHCQAYAYDTLRLLAQAVESAGFTRAEIRDYLASLGDSRPPYAGVSGEFAPARRLDLRKAYVLEIRDNKFVLISGP